MYLWRRAAAGLYDSFILISCWMLATFIALWIRDGESFGPLHMGYIAYLISVSYGLYTWCWWRSGQTLGMLAWRIKVIPTHQQPMTWPLATGRFFISLVTLSWLGLGWLWCFFDQEQRALQDRLSRTRIVCLAKPSRK